MFATNLTVGQSVGRIVEIDGINATSNERWYPDGRVEPIKTVRVEVSPLYNHDLAPVPISRRTWTTYNYAALWISMAHCIPNYMLASGLMAAGMSWAQALLFLPVFVPSLTAMIGSWATLSINMSDFTRFGRSQRGQMVGQVVALPTTMTVFAAMGVVITSATVVIYGQAIWDPVQLVGKFRAPVVVAIAMFTIVVATLAVNIAANVVSPANDFANAFPRLVRFKTGGLITGIIGILIQPWKLLADPSAYIFTWMLGYSGGLGSIAGVLIVDYWLLRRRRLQLEDLYLTEGAYRYRNGWNWNAVTATATGCALAWGGLVVPVLGRLYDYSWFVGLLTSAAVYWTLSVAASRSPLTAQDATR